MMLFAAFQKALAAEAPNLSQSELETILSGAGDARFETYKHLIPHYIDGIETGLQSLALPGYPVLGQDFARAIRRAKCNYVINRDPLSAQAFYTAYSPEKGFTNEVSFNPEKITLEKFHVFFGSSNHEHLHGLQNQAAPALKYTPWNPDTTVILHPLDKLRLDNLCERDAYAKQALFDALYARYAGPVLQKTILEDSKFNVLRADEMEQLLATGAPLQDVLIQAAAQSLEKPFDPDVVNGRNFNNSYHASSLRDYAGAMAKRRKQDPDVRFQFIRLEDEDFHAIGDYGVGPNSLGAQTLDPRFGAQMYLDAPEWDKFCKLCGDYDIPLRENCPTLRDYLAPAPQNKVDAPYQGASAFSFASPQGFQPFPA